MEITISNWGGRTCNNIIQVTNAILMAKTYKLKFNQTLYHPIIDKFSLDFTENISYDLEAIKAKIDNCYPHRTSYAEFYDPHACPNFFNCFYTNDIDKEELRNIYYNFIFPNLKINKNLKALDSNTLVLHIRSGDVIRDDVLIDQVNRYSNDNKIILYAVPPINMYEKLISKFEKVIIVAEDRLNPAINYLESKYPEKVTVQTGSLKEDIELILSAENLAGSSIFNGTFLYTMSRLSKNLKNMYIFEFMERNYENEYNYPENITIHVLLTRNYYDDYNIARIITWDSDIEEISVKT